MTRIKNAPSSVIAYGDATFPPCGGKALGVRFTGFPPRGEAVEQTGAPNVTQRKRSHWGEDEQRSE